MAVYRQIQITFWQDSFVLKLTPEEKFFYLYLLTNSKTKQCGIYELPIQVIQVETGYNRDTVTKLIQRFIEHKKISYDWENEEVFLHNWIKHNPFENNPKILKCIENELKSVHNPDMIPLTSPLQGVYKGVYNNNNNNNKNKKNNKEDILTYFQSKDYPVEEAESFFNHYESQGWVTGNGVPIINWKSKAENWHKEQMRRANESKSGTKQYKKGEFDPEKFRKLLNNPPKF